MKTPTLAEFISEKIANCGRSQIEIADEIGYTKPNIITMFKQGKTKVPINKIGPLANAIHVSPVQLMQLAMNEYMPETWRAVEDAFGLPLNAEEQKLIHFLRKYSDNFEMTSEFEKDLKDAAEKHFPL